jgi:hypothetical protein
MPGFPPGVHLLGGQASIESNRRLAQEFYAPIIPIVVDLHGQGLSLRAIARELDRMGIMTRHAWDWSATQVRRVLARAREAEAGRDPEDRAAEGKSEAPPHLHR